jgi:hypothetical protein
LIECERTRAAGQRIDLLRSDGIDARAQVGVEARSRLRRTRGEVFPPRMNPLPLDAAGCFHLRGEKTPCCFRWHTASGALRHDGLQRGCFPRRIVYGKILRIFGPRDLRREFEPLARQ